MNIGIDHVAFEFVGQHIWATSTYQIGAHVFVKRDIYGNVVTFMKRQCQKATTQLITKLQGRLPTQDLMDALGVVCPQYWLQLKPEKRFNVHLAIIKATLSPMST
jgi:hypothetical protein